MEAHCTLQRCLPRHVCTAPADPANNRSLDMDHPLDARTSISCNRLSSFLIVASSSLILAWRAAFSLAQSPSILRTCTSLIVWCGSGGAAPRGVRGRLQLGHQGFALGDQNLNRAAKELR